MYPANHESLAYYEGQIGIQPNTGKAHSTLEQLIKVNTLKHTYVRNWLSLTGLSFELTKHSKVEALAKAYLNPAYRNGWIRNISTHQTAGADFALDAALPKVNDSAVAEAPVSASNAVSADFLKTLFNQVETTAEKLFQEKLKNTQLKLSDDAKRQIREIATSAAIEVATSVATALAKPRVIELFNPETKITNNIGRQHYKFDLLLRAAMCRTHTSHRLNIWLTGPTGSGKTTAAINVAKALDLPFEAEGALDADFKLMGYMAADGHYVETAFFRRYTQGGIILLDEIDSYSPSAMLALNAATANGFAQFPHGKFDKHKDCLIIAAANTWGLGATNEYVGRTRLDAASLDRFQPKIDWPVDVQLERSIAEDMAGTKGLYWHDIILNARHKAKDQGLKIIISPRATFNGISLAQQGFSWSDVVDMTIASGLSSEQKKALEINALPLEESPPKSTAISVEPCNAPFELLKQATDCSRDIFNTAAGAGA